MEHLLLQHLNRLKNHKSKFSRELKVQWQERLIGITGARGVGKTTFVLQHAKKQFGYDKQCLYISLDNIYFSGNKLYDLAAEFERTGGKLLILDEVHYYPTWSQEIKNIYDDLPDLQVIFTGSSVLHIHLGNTDLSRRAVLYKLEGLSFREYINIESGLDLPQYSLDQILHYHTQIAMEICEKVKPYAYFLDYLHHGYYPFYLQNIETYPQKLAATVNQVLDVDLPLASSIESKNINKLKKLLYLLSVSTPFEPNISKLSEQIEATRQTVLIYLQALEDARLINQLRVDARGYKTMTKPEKIMMHNPNLIHAVGSQNADVGSLRETFFFNQVSVSHELSYPERGDFLVDGEYLFEIGGKAKTNKQIKEHSKGYVVSDGIEVGMDNKIPLYLFGFLY
jgi:predicted AAA+ superfamily ATPase